MMILAVLFIVFWFIGLLIGGYKNREDYQSLGGFGITWFLFALLGLKVFWADFK